MVLLGLDWMAWMEQADEANHPYHVKEIINFMH